MQNVKQKLTAAAVYVALAISVLSLWKSTHVQAPASPHRLGATVVEQGLRLNQLAPPNAAVAMNSQKLTGLANGTTSGDAVHFGQTVTTSGNGLYLATDYTTWTQWLAGPTNFTYDTDDFVWGGSATGTASLASNNSTACGKLNWRCFGSGTSSGVSLVTTGQNGPHRGVVNIFTGTTTTGIGAVLRDAASTPNITLASGQNWTQKWYAQWPTLSNGTDTYASYLGWTTGGATPADGCFATYSSAAPQSGQIICRTCASPSCTTGTGGTPPTVIGGTWYHIEVDWDGTNCSCKVDNVGIGSTASTIPTASITQSAVVVKSAGTTSVNLLLDYYSELQIDAAGR